MASVLLIDNFDSFTFNIFHGLTEVGAQVEVCRRDRLSLNDVESLKPSLIVLSPGPGRPEDAGLCLDVAGQWAGRVPIFGICLGLQVLALSQGGSVGRAPEPVHGKMSKVRHDGRGCFEGLVSPLEVGRYHSLCVTQVPTCMEVAARTEEGLVMALRHREVAMAGVQFHPDSFLTQGGLELLRNVAHGHL
jgi:anthranilate synthase/aminodeoxychorismate synthase-like glutamine amidotransferase